MSPQIPKHWSIATFKEVFDRLQYGLTAKAESSNAGIRFLRITDINNGSIDWSSVPSCVEPEGDISRYILADGDFVFARSGSIEKAARLREVPASVFASYLIRGRPKDASVSDWLAWFIRSNEYLMQIKSAAAGIGMSNVNAQKLGAVTLPLPPESERRLIIAKLDRLLARSKVARDELAHIPKLVERYKRSVLSAAYQGKLTAEWCMQNSAPPMEFASLEHITSENIRNGLSVRGSDNPPGVRSLRLSALRSGVVDLNDVRYLPISDDQAERFLLREGDVLVSRGNGTKAFVGLAAIVRKLSQPTIFPDTSFRLRLLPKKASPDWLALIWNAPEVRTQIESAAKTTAGIWKVSQGDLAKIVMMLPSVEEQHEIVRLVTSAFSNIDRLAAESGRAAELINRLDQAILAKAFRGEMTTDDPAEQGLLETVG